MKECAVPAGKIYFLDFIFNPKFRTLQRYDSVLQLRKKQSDVLALLCAKYPEPVSQAEFLAEVWGSGYVTSQSIAQMICSLRSSLGDEGKSIIATIPKLGYQLTVKPCWEEPEPEPELNKTSSDLGFPRNIEEDSLCFSSAGMLNVISGQNHTRSVDPFSVVKVVSDKRKFSPKKFFFCSAAALVFGLLCFAMTDKSNLLNFVKNHDGIGLLSTNKLIERKKNDFLSCAATEEGENCQSQLKFSYAGCNTW